jgi:hypothetical protein
MNLQKTPGNLVRISESGSEVQQRGMNGAGCAVTCLIGTRYFQIDDILGAKKHRFGQL